MKRTGLRLRLPLPMTAAVTIIFACQVYGQGFATISGNITDASGGVLPNAHVTATQVSTGVSRTALSNSEGIFVLPLSRPRLTR